MNLVKSIDFFQYVLIDHSGREDYPDFNQDADEQKEIIQPVKAVAKIEEFLKLGKPGKFDLSDLNDFEKDEFLIMFYELINCGVIDCEQVEKDGLCEKFYTVNEIEDDWTAGIL
jgi:hypothetical protein